MQDFADNAAPPLSAIWHAPGPEAAVTGVIATPLAVRNAAPAPRRFAFTLSLPAVNRTLLASELLLGPDPITIDLKLHTHLLPNGIQTLAVTLIDPAGTAVWSGTATLRIANTGTLAGEVRRSLESFGTPVAFIGPCDSGQYDFADPTLLPWFNRPDPRAHIRARLESGAISEQEAAWLRAFATDGFVVLEDILEDELVSRIGTELEDAVARGVEGYRWGSSQRIHNLHQQYPGVRGLWSHARILRLLELIFEQPARPCQTLTYIFGSQQDTHQDTVHLTPFPAGYMCGVWVAIDDVQPDSGELVVYRGSQHLPRIMLRDVGCAKVVNNDWREFGAKVVSRWVEMEQSNEFERIVFRPKRGTVLIWHENLLHAGGRRINQALSRRSVVSHVFADGVVGFYDSSGMAGSMEPLENLPPR